MFPENMVYDYGRHSSGLEEVPVADTSEHSHELWGFKKDGDFLLAE